MSLGLILIILLVIFLLTAARDPKQKRQGFSAHL
jgi:hypothetical protein